MKLILATVVAILGIAGGVAAHASPAVTLLGTAHSTGAFGQGTEQTVVVRTDGSVHATLSDSGVVTTMDISIKGNDVFITKTQPWGVSTTTVDLTASKAFEDSHPELVAKYLEGMSISRSFREAHPAQTSVSPLAAGGVACNAQAQAMIQAGYDAIAVCQAGPSIGCSEATAAYNAAVAAYNACVAEARI